jgi:hypothetical protein
VATANERVLVLAAQPDGKLAPLRISELGILQTGGGSGGIASDTVALDADTLAALETVTIANPTADPETGLAKEVTLAAILAELSGSDIVALDAATLAALETISVANFPASQPVTGPLTDVELRAVAVPISGTVTVSNPTAAPETGLAKDATLVDRIPDLVGTWGYYAGAAGTVVVAAGRRVIGIAAHATVAGSMTVDGGASIPIPANTGITFAPQGNLIAPTIVFTSTDSYVVETLT